MKTVNITGVPFPVSSICLGTAFFGDTAGTSKELSFELMDYYYRQGGYFFNTAHEYGGGVSEMCVGEWIKSRGLSRDSFLLTTKGGEDIKKPPRCVAMHREELLEDIDESLERLQLDYVDFYLLHIDDPEISVEEIVSTLEEIRRAGKTRYYGCSNWSSQRQRAAMEYAKKQGYQGFVVDEIEYSIARPNRINAERSIKWLDEEFEELHNEDGVCVGAYSALVHGIFTKYLRNGNFKNATNGFYGHDAWYKVFTNPYNLELARRLKKLSEETGWSVSQILLAWMTDKPRKFPCFSIIGASKLSQLEDSLASDKITLTADMLAFLAPDRKEFPDGVDLRKKGIEFPFGLE